MKQWYEVLFENYARRYDQECFVQGTVGECDFIEKEIAHNKSTRIIDIGCGTGRHAIELTKRGYQVTVVDLSESQLKRAREKATEQGLSIVFQKQDARALPFQGQFDLAIMLCEGAFSLMETDEMNFEILKGATNALKENGKLIFTTLNGLFPLYHSVEQFCAAGANKETMTYRSKSFDLMTFREHNHTTLEDDAGNKMELECNERFYVPSEITWLLGSLGYREIGIFGAKLGAYSRNDALTTEDFEMLVVAQR
jgi:2-polyprenyl-3-methyl-5-hydroxy-6-metoxy-1,4-benzoquinol methylase